MLFSKEEQEVLKEYSRICLALHELKEKTKVMKQAKKMYEEKGPENYPVNVFDILGKVEIGKSIAIKDVGVELTNKKKKRMTTLTKGEIQKRLNSLIEDETQAVLVYTNLTDKRYREKVIKNVIECKVGDS